MHTIRSDSIVDTLDARGCHDPRVLRAPCHPTNLPLTCATYRPMTVRPASPQHHVPRGRRVFAARAPLALRAPGGSSAPETARSPPVSHRLFPAAHPPALLRSRLARHAQTAPARFR